MSAIGTLLEQTVAELGRFVALIAAERQALISGDIDQLPAIAEKKSVLATSIASLETQRDTMLAAAGYDLGRAGVSAWLIANPTKFSGSTPNVWKVYQDLATEARHENEINGKLIAARLQQNQQALEVLLGTSANTSNTYGADGQTRTTGAGRRPLGSA